VCGVGAINYDIEFKPSEPSAQLSLDSASSQSLVIKLDSVGLDDVILKPAGNVGEQILSGIVWPVAQLLTEIMKGKIKDEIQGTTKEIKFGSPPGYSFSVEGVVVKVEATSWSLGAYEDMLMATGAGKVS
jgi:hypothetical protein